MNITFKALEDIKKGDLVLLDFDTGYVSLYREDELGLQPKEEANIVEGDH